MKQLLAALGAALFLAGAGGLVWEQSAFTEQALAACASFSDPTEFTDALAEAYRTSAPNFFFWEPVRPLLCALAAALVGAAGGIGALFLLSWQAWKWALQVRLGVATLWGLGAALLTWDGWFWIYSLSAPELDLVAWTLGTRSACSPGGAPGLFTGPQPVALFVAASLLGALAGGALFLRLRRRA